VPARPCCARSRHFAAGMHQAAVPDGSKQEGKGKSKPRTRVHKLQSASATACRGRKRDVTEDPAIFPQRYLAFGAAVEIVEHSFRQSFGARWDENPRCKPLGARQQHEGICSFAIQGSEV
jgi:hypothetical protein